MIELTKNELGIVRCMTSRRSDTVLLANMEGNIGRTWVDQKENPKIAVIVAGDFAYLLGNVESLHEKVNILLSTLEECKGKIIVTDESTWVSILSKYYTDTFRRFNRYSFKKEMQVFQMENLKENIKIIKPDFQITKIDERIYHMLLQDPFMADCCSFFSSIEEFMEHGIGFVIIKDNQIVAGASSYTFHEGCIEVTIGTHVQYRRKGLALACASRLILECLNRNIYPNWDAANLESVSLAEKLGYQFESEYEVYSI